MNNEIALYEFSNYLQCMHLKRVTPRKRKVLTNDTLNIMSAIYLWEYLDNDIAKGKKFYNNKESMMRLLDVDSAYDCLECVIYFIDCYKEYGETKDFSIVYAYIQYYMELAYEKTLTNFVIDDKHSWKIDIYNIFLDGISLKERMKYYYETVFQSNVISLEAGKVFNNGYES